LKSRKEAQRDGRPGVIVRIHGELQTGFAQNVSDGAPKSDSAFLFARLYGVYRVYRKGIFPIVEDQSDSPAPPGPACFDATRWTVVLEAAQSRAPGGPEALGQLCARYWQPLYAFARRRGQGPEDAQDLVQGFFAQLIEHRALRGVERAQGRFRSFLLASFQNFMANESRRARTKKRGGGAKMLRLDWEDEEGRLAFEPQDPLTPETLYDARWALLVLGRATRRLEQEQMAAGRVDAFWTLKSFLGDEGTRANVSYEQAARTLKVGLPTLKTLIHRLRQRHAQLVRSEVERTVADPAEVDAELRSLREALVMARGRVET
jgi:RNA polymerase sigma-70 factor (ECF subfamily)